MFAFVGKKRERNELAWVLFLIFLFCIDYLPHSVELFSNQSVFYKTLSFSISGSVSVRESRHGRNRSGSVNAVGSEFINIESITYILCI
jgi:hypothetical protein